MRKVTLVSKLKDKSWEGYLFEILAENETHIQLSCLNGEFSTPIILIKADYDIIPADNFKGGDIGELSDGYHTFNELYDHRQTLFCCLMNSHPDLSWKSRQHADGTIEGDWFIAGMNLPSGMITYHLEGRFWDMAKIEELVSVIPEWDGHTSADVIERLKQWRI